MKNVLIQYKGGGYDGCFWEWNYAVYDKKGKFYDIISSGYAGIDNTKTMRFYISSKQNRLDTDFYLYNLSSAKDLKDFVEFSNPYNIIEVKKFLDKNLNFDLSIFCNECGNEPEFQEEIIENDEIFCNECYSLATCGCCSEFYGVNYTFDYGTGYCADCINELIEE